MFARLFDALAASDAVEAAGMDRERIRAAAARRPFRVALLFALTAAQISGGG